MISLFNKYDVPVPRYTSYPTVPYWSETPTQEIWIKHLRDSMSSPDSSWSMYIHIPYCETLCTFCGCNNTITKDHKKEIPYVENLLKEFHLYLEKVPELKTKPLKHLHMGGGTPTFLSAESLEKLLKPIMESLTLVEHSFEASIEVDPRRTSVEQLQVLRKLGFNRISLGVQDFDPEVQRLVNRIQPFAMTEKITTESRKLGYESVNFDLIYGLAKQTPESIRKTAELTVQLRPDRIALYSFALVPWIKPQQRLFKDEDLPKKKEKWDLYWIAREVLLNAGYVEVGMDHFALATDALAVAMNEGRLHRNFMGYTDQKTDVMLGLGVSSISETPWSFHQNEKVLSLYEEKVNSGQLPTHRGHVHTEQDLKRRSQILKLMTQFKVEFESLEQANFAKEFLKEMVKDDLVEITDTTMTLKPKGRPFLRNASLVFDERLREKQPKTSLFSGAI